MRNNLILAVDDDPSVLMLVETILSANGFTVETAAGGVEALEKLTLIKPSVVILDIMMPEVSGYDVILRMKQQVETQNIPVILLSAKGEPDDLLKGYTEFGVEYYITKPFTQKQLLAGIKTVLG